VLAASRYIPAYTRLDPASLAWREIPAEYLPKGSLDKLEDAVDMLTLAPLSQGEPVLFNKLAHASQSLAAAVPEGLRAFSLGVDAVSGVSGLLRPGDRVDVLLLSGESDHRAMAATLFQAAAVLAVGSQYAPDDKGQAEGGSTVTLALSPQDCEIALFAQSKGRLQLSLRATGDRETRDLRSVDFSAVLARLGSSPGRRPGGSVEIIRGGGER
jgi:pilus assembly protein CpaB